jgi:fructokinase
MSKKIAVIGEALIDLIQQPDGSYQAKTGGAPANVSIALARLGTEVTFIARMSVDAFGVKLHDWLAPESINLAHLIRTTDPTTLAVATLDDHGKASYSFYIDGTADWGLTDLDLADLVTMPPAAFVIGSVALVIEPGAGSIERTAAQLHDSDETTVVIDLNIRPGLGFERDSERTRIERQIRTAHVIKASDEDIAWLYTPNAVESVAADWSQSGRAVIVTRGSAGATLYLDGSRVADVAAPTIELVDTVGAGDSFLGATLFGLQERDALGDDPVERLRGLSAQDWSDVLTLAARVGAITCSRAGCNPPTRAELGV